MSAPEQTREQIRAGKITGRFLYGCAQAMRMRAINVRPAVQVLVLTKNGYTQNEADEIVDQVADRWGKMSTSAQLELRRKVEAREVAKAIGMRRR